MIKQLNLIITLIILLTSCQSKKDRINSKIHDHITGSDFNGIMYVAHKDESLYYGTIQNETLSLKCPEKNTKIYLASLTKLFTEIAILKLHESKQIDLNKPISTYRTSFNPTYGKRVKVLDLLKMKSGLPRELNPGESLGSIKLDETNKAGPFMDTIPDIQLSFEPGTKEEYSNLNYWILGIIIEEITDSNIEDAFEQLIFNELNMKNSGIFISASPPIHGYVYNDNKWDIDSFNYAIRYASGGFYSTIEDLVILSHALKGKTFLSKESLEILTNSTNKVQAFGSLPGYSNMYIQDIEKGYTIIALNNIGLRDLSSMTALKSAIENELGIAAKKRNKKSVKLFPINKLNDTIDIEKALKSWSLAVVSEDAQAIFKIIDDASVKGSMQLDDPTWKDLSRLKTDLPNFKALGYRWVKDEQPEGVEVWFGSDAKGKIAIRWLLNEKDSTLVENIFIMPDDMTWQGKSY